MPSRYYNPRLAKNLADAYKQEVYDFATPVQEAFQPFVQMTKERYERMQREKEKEEIAQERIRREQNADFANMKTFNPEKIDDPMFRDYALSQSIDYQQRYRWAVENLEGFAKQKMLNELNDSVDNLYSQYQTLGAYQQDYKDRRNPDQPGGDRTSHVNSAVVNYIDSKKANMEYDEVVNVDGRPAFVFKAESSNGVLDEDVVIPIDQYATAYTPMERQTKKYTDTLALFDDMINTAKREQRWEDDPENKSQMESIIESTKYTEEEALSIAVDQLGMEQAEYAGIIQGDLDGDGEYGTIDDINMFIKDQLRQGVRTTLTNLRKAYEKNFPKTTTTPTIAETKEQQRVENYTYVGDKLEAFIEQMQQNQPDFIKDQVNWLQVESTFFKDMASGMGFSGFVSVTDNNKKVIAVEVTNEVTNNKAYIPVGSNTEQIIKRLMIAAGATPREADIYYMEKYQALPGLEQK